MLYSGFRRGILLKLLDFFPEDGKIRIGKARRANTAKGGVLQ